MSAALHRAAPEGMAVAEFLLSPDDEFGPRQQLMGSQQLIDGGLVTVPPLSDVDALIRADLVVRTRFNASTLSAATPLAR